MAQNHNAVLLLAHGTPDTVEGVPEFLRNVTGGRALPPQLIEEIQHRYKLIGKSPLNEITRAQAHRVQEMLGIPVYVGIRNWPPYIPDVVQQMGSDGVQHAVAICLAPQNSRTSIGLYKQAVFGKATDSYAAERTYPPVGPPPNFAIEFVENWHDHPLLIQAFVERLAAGWKRACQEAASKIPVIFTAHSVPQRTIAAGDPYEQQAKETAALVAAQVPGLADQHWRFAFQSQGMSGGPWLGPSVEETIVDLKKAGHSGVFVQPIGFVADHVEVLYDVDILFRQFAEQNGMRLWRAESLNESTLFCAALADIARARLGTGQPLAQASGDRG
jgi:ferrochelatase